jgi:uncharacterized membrane protein
MKDLLSNIIIRFSSRKFLLAVVGVAVVFGVPLTGSQIAAITTLIVAFTAAEGYADAVERSS